MDLRFFVELKHVGNQLKNIGFLVYLVTILWNWDFLLNSKMQETSSKTQVFLSEIISFFYD